MKDSEEIAARALGQQLAAALTEAEDRAALVLFDVRCVLARVVAEAYRLVLPEATSLDFDRTNNTSILTGFELLRSGDLVVLIQSTEFALDLEGVRRDLHRREVRLIEHAQLAHLEGSDVHNCLEQLGLAPQRPSLVFEALARHLDQRSGSLDRSPDINRR